MLDSAQKMLGWLESVTFSNGTTPRVNDSTEGISSESEELFDYAKRLGIKRCGGQYVASGNILIRQRSLKIQPGLNVGCGRDYTLYALKNGYVNFESRQTKFKKFKKVNIII